MNFWKKLSLPIIGLSPMDGVTDHPFRHTTKKYGHPGVIYTEFTSVEGVCHGADRLLEDFLFDESQRPIVAQIYGTTPEFFRETATLLCELGFDGIDINMGCPAKNVAHSGAGAALIETPKLALEIIRSTKAGVQDYFSGKRSKDCAHITSDISSEVEKRFAKLPIYYQTRHETSYLKPTDIIPVSIKTRVGYRKKIVEQWIPTLMTESPAAIAVHGRTLKQQYGGSADWEEIAKGAQYTKGTGTIYLGNGDALNREQALEKVKMYGVDGVLIGRGAFGNPFCFLPENERNEHDQYDLFKIALEHAELYEQTYKPNNPKYNFLPMRKHLGWYVKGIEGASEIRQKIFQCSSLEEVKKVFAEYNLIK